MFISLPVSGRGLSLLLLFSLLFTVFLFKAFSSRLPLDRGRALAFEGGKSKGKRTGTGVVFISGFVFSAMVLLKLSLELRLYLLAVLFEMMTGFFDDQAKKPWSETVKGLLDFAVALFVAMVYLMNNDTGVHLSLAGGMIHLPSPLFFVLIVILVWESINTTNITDGVDGLSGTLAIITLLSFVLAGSQLGSMQEIKPVIWMLIGALFVYLWFNVSPGTHLMGDAGSRAIGMFIAIVALKSKAPFLYIPLALVFILDGSSSLLKLSVRRYLKRKQFMDGILTPLHDHTRKRFGWSDVQTVMRFALIQLFVSALVILSMKV